jgi:hypothetical protein
MTAHAEESKVGLLTGQGNFAIIKLPQRRFPDAAFQGD